MFDAVDRSTGMRAGFVGGNWRSTAAINEVTLGLNSVGSNWIVGTTAVLYGIS